MAVRTLRPSNGGRRAPPGNWFRASGGTKSDGSTHQRLVDLFRRIGDFIAGFNQCEGVGEVETETNVDSLVTNFVKDWINFFLGNKTNVKCRVIFQVQEHILIVTVGSQFFQGTN